MAERGATAQAPPRMRGSWLHHRSCVASRLRLDPRNVRARAIRRSRGPRASITGRMPRATVSPPLVSPPSLAIVRDGCQGSRAAGVPPSVIESCVAVGRADASNPFAAPRHDAAVQRRDALLRAPCRTNRCVQRPLDNATRGLLPSPAASEYPLILIGHLALPLSRHTPRGRSVGAWRVVGTARREGTVNRQKSFLLGLFHGDVSPAPASAVHSDKRWKCERERSTSTPIAATGSSGPLPTDEER